MAEDDEIDILGDFNLDNFLLKSDPSIYENTTLVSQNSELLNCDYTIHPQWLLDKPSANPDCWYDTNSVLSTELPNKSQPDFGTGDNDHLGHLSTENSITDESGWTEKEKNLLERGIEIFGKSNVRLSQFIGSRTPSEVKYYLKNFYSEAQANYSDLNGGMVEEMNFVADILDETQIPASIEEVIAAVSTAKTTVQVKRAHKKSCHEDESRNTPENGDASTKLNPITKTRGKKSVKFKFRTKLKIPMNPSKSAVKQKTVKVMNKENKKTEIGKLEITTGKGLSVPICEGEEIVKISKTDSDSDLEIDVEDAEDVKPLQPEPIKQIKNENPPTIKKEKLEILDKDCTKQKSYIDLENLDGHLVKELTCMEVPKSEVKMHENFITDLEKAIHSEFFEGRPTKTPLRYLRIRNHIINAWLTSKPSYVTKTSIRQGLKNCGDVNCISRIHCYLEQTGVINFGCSQTSYSRPLFDVFQALAPSTRTKPGKEITSPIRMDLGARPRSKRKFANDGEGGCTLTHNERGDVINTTIVKEEPPKAKLYIKKPSIRLIYSRPFPTGSPQKFKVKMRLSTLLLMDLHAHTSLTEVMGLVGGSWDSGGKVLTISHYEPCKNIASSATHCDMCPISQSHSAELIHALDLDILGWFHSHPTFAPEPSQQDLDTQQDLQRWIGAKIPCLGVILSPFSSNGALIASPYRCMIVDRKEHFEDQFVPYKFTVELICESGDYKQFFKDVGHIMKFEPSNKKINFSKPYFQDVSITYLEKYVTSVRMHLAKCGNLNKMTCDYIIENILNICSNV